jgi:hypothetical protein
MNWWQQRKLYAQNISRNNVLLYLVQALLFWLIWMAAVMTALRYFDIIYMYGRVGPKEFWHVIFAIGLSLFWIIAPYTLPEKLYRYKRDKNGVPQLSWLFRVTFYLLIAGIITATITWQLSKWGEPVYREDRALSSLMMDVSTAFERQYATQYSA